VPLLQPGQVCYHVNNGTPTPPSFQSCYGSPCCRCHSLHDAGQKRNQQQPSHWAAALAAL
jgi:hypothetical protein